jgi:hypothetical protein
MNSAHGYEVRLAWGACLTPGQHLSARWAWYAASAACRMERIRRLTVRFAQSEN